MKSEKKIFALILTLSTVSILIGCGNSVPAVNENNAVEMVETMESDAPADEIIDRVGEIKDEEEGGASREEPTATATPAPTETLEPTPEPTPEPHVHQWVETVTRQPSCATAGEKKLTCECGEEKTEAIPATGNHSWVEGTTVIHHEALGHVETVETQVQVGTSAGRTEYECKSCGARFDTPSAKEEHCKTFIGVDNLHARCGTIAYDFPGEPIYETRTESVWKVDQEAWDETVGTGIYTCSVCGATK